MLGRDASKGGDATPYQLDHFGSCLGASVGQCYDVGFVFVFRSHLCALFDMSMRKIW